MREASLAWLNLIERQLEHVDNVPNPLFEALELTRSVKALTDPSEIKKGLCNYEAVAMLSAATVKSDKSYVTRAAIMIDREPGMAFYKDTSRH